MGAAGPLKGADVKGEALFVHAELADAPKENDARACREGESLSSFTSILGDI